HALTPSGGVRSEFTIMRDGPQAFYLVSSGAAERYDHDLLLKEMPDDGSVRVENITTSHGVLVVAGPKSRDILRQVTDADLSSNAFPWLSGQMIDVGMARLRAMRVNFVGELGWELHHPIEMQHVIFDALMAAGHDHGLTLVGMRAMDSLRLEKSYRMWGQDLTTQYTPLEASLDRFARLDKGDFTGRAALQKQLAAGIPNRFVTLAVAVDEKDPDGPADARGNEPVYKDGRMVGRATAGGYGHTVGQSLALAYVAAGAEAVGTTLEIDILGKRHQAVVIAESPHDPGNQRLRA
ncbi:MAG: aminomethyltransferase family protein, partial [Alphaproteobacteria bacterium]